MENQASTLFYVAGGTLHPGTPSYVERQADNKLYEHALAGDFCYVLTTRQMGKSSLMARTAARLKTAGVGIAIVDLSNSGGSKGAEHEKDLAGKWYKGVARAIIRSLNLRVDLNDWWREREDLPALQRLTEFFSDLVLAHTRDRVVIFVDEIDTTIKLPFADDFFAAIRACYNARATETVYNRLSFVLLGVASPSDLIKDTTRTPFNIGHRIELTDFTLAEAAPLARGLGATTEQCQQALRRILHWTGGHPYLTQLLCLAVAQEQMEDDSAAELEAGIDALVERYLLSPQASRENYNLNFVRDRMTKDARRTPAMLRLYRRIRRGEKVNDDVRSPVQTGLKLTGLVTSRADGSLSVRNRVYEHVFTDEWAKKAMPVDRRRQAIASALALLLLGFGLWYTLFLPRQWEGELQRALDDYPTEAYAKLHHLPGFGGKANELLAQFWERRALREESWGKRDEALLSRLQDISARPSDLRRSEANQLVGTDYNNLLMTYRHSAKVNAVAFSPDGKLLLTGSDDRTARLWRADSGQLVLTLRHDELVLAVAFSRDGKLILTGSHDRTARLWRVDSGELLLTLQHDSIVNAVAFSPDDKLLLTGSGDLIGRAGSSNSSGKSGTARLWRVDSGELLSTLRHNAKVYAVAFSPDGKFILTGSSDATARLWRADSGQLLSTLQHESSVLAVAFGPDGKLLLTGGYDNTARLWRADSGQLLSILRHCDTVRAVAFSSDGKHVLTGSGDLLSRSGIARLWRVDSGQVVSILRHDDGVYAVAFSPDGKLALTGSADATARLWRVDSGELRSTLPHDELVRAVAFSPDGKHLLTASGDLLSRSGIARLWRIDSGQLRLILRHESSVRAVAFSPDGNWLLTVDGDLIDRSDMRQLRADSVKLSAYIEFIQPRSGTARLWRADSGQLLSTLPHEKGVLAVAFSPDGKFLLTGSHDRTARLWRVDSGELLSTLRHESSILAVAFSPDGKLLLTGGYDNTTRLWRADSGQPKLRLALRQDDGVLAVAFSPDNKLILTGSSDATVRLWRADSGQLLSILRHDDSIRAVAFSPDGKYAIATTDNWIHLAAVSEGGLIHRASRCVLGSWYASGFHFNSSDGSNLQIAWLPTGDRLKIDTLRFDIPDALPLPGDPATLLAEWSKRLALKFDERQKIVPLWPVEAVKENRPSPR